MAQVKLIARRALTHDGRALRAGEAFETTALKGAILVYRQHASFAPRTPPPAEPPVEPPLIDAPSRRHSKRRDITPDPDRED